MKIVVTKNLLFATYCEIEDGGFPVREKHFVLLILCFVLPIPRYAFSLLLQINRRRAFVAL